MTTQPPHLSCANFCMRTRTSSPISRCASAPSAVMSHGWLSTSLAVGRPAGSSAMSFSSRSLALADSARNLQEQRRRRGKGRVGWGSWPSHSTECQSCTQQCTCMPQALVGWGGGAGLEKPRSPCQWACSPGKQAVVSTQTCNAGRVSRAACPALGTCGGSRAGARIHLQPPTQDHVRNHVSNS